MGAENPGLRPALCGLLLYGMTQRILLFCAGISLAAAGIFAAAPEVATPSNLAQAARLNNLGTAYMNQQLFDKALKSFEQAIAADPGLESARTNQGIALLALGRADEAKRVLQAAVKADGKDLYAWYNLGLLFKNNADSPSAIDAFRHVAEIDPNDPDTWYFLGSIYAQNRQLPEAIDAFQRALKLNPLHASAEFGLARALQQSGDLAHAHEHMQRFQYLTQNKLGAPLSLAYGEQGKYSRTEQSQAGQEKVPEAIPVHFVEVSEAAGLLGKRADSASDLPSFLGPGACFLDYDGDGKQDIFLPDNGPQGGMALYHNLGDGKFEEVTKKAGLDPALHGIGCTAGDYDNDGATDLAVEFQWTHTSAAQRKERDV